MSNLNLKFKSVNDYLNNKCPYCNEKLQLLDYDIVSDTIVKNNNDKSTYFEGSTITYTLYEPIIVKSNKIYSDICGIELCCKNHLYYLYACPSEWTPEVSGLGFKYLNIMSEDMYVFHKNDSCFMIRNVYADIFEKIKQPFMQINTLHKVYQLFNGNMPDIRNVSYQTIIQHDSVFDFKNVDYDLLSDTISSYIIYS